MSGEETAQAEEVVQEESATSTEPEVTESEETPAEAETEATDTEGDDEPKEQKDDSEEKTGAQKRIDKLTWKMREAERRAEEAERRAADFEKRMQPPEQPRQESRSERPTLESVGYDEEAYVKAVDDYLGSKIDETLTQREQRLKQESESKAFTEKLSDFHSRGAAMADDWDEMVAMNSSLPVTESMGQALVGIENGPEVLYHLASNPADIDRIASLNPIQQALEIGRLGERMKLPKPNTVSKAPKPIKPLSAGGESVSKDPDDMSPSEWLKWRNKQLKG